LAALIIFLIAPVLGAISDFSAAKKRFLLTFAYGGSLFTILLYFCHSGDVIKTLLIFFIAQIGFIAGNVFYDAFLPQIASEDKIDWVSGKGFSYGYFGGGLQFAIALGLVAGHEPLGLSQSQAARLGIAMAGFWWAGFTLFTVKHLHEAPRAEVLPEKYQKKLALLAYMAVGFSNLLTTIRRVSRFRHLLLFLIAYMLYNDGIQTVINMATIYGKEELNLTTTNLMVTLLVIQVIAIFGALFFSRIAAYIGAKRAVMVTLVLWSGVVVYAYFIKSAAEYFALGIAVGIVLGGSQALSRSLYGSMIPEEASAEFYGFYSVFSKFSAIWGPMVFAVIRQVAGSSRLSIISLIIFFIAGLILLSFVDEKKAREAKKAGPF
jgi:UMF1 family MFS transporter